jgi:holliday junction resolvase YEN1
LAADYTSPSHTHIYGFDHSLWLWQSTQQNHGGAGENPELRIQFFRLARLRRFAMPAVFVFDGKGRPDFKRGATTVARPHWLTVPMQELVTAFRFTWYTVRAEIVSHPSVSS